MEVKQKSFRIEFMNEYNVKNCIVIHAQNESDAIEKCLNVFGCIVIVKCEGLEEIE